MLSQMYLPTLAGLAGCFLLAQHAPAAPAGSAGTADEAANPYAAISNRNVFHLHPAPPTPEPEPPKADLPVVKLTGFLKIGKQVRALFCVLPREKKDGPTYCDLSEGEKSAIAQSGYLEVRTIRYDKGEVDVINSGTPATLSLKEDALGEKQQPPSNIPGRHAPGGFALRTPPGFRVGPPQTPFQNPGDTLFALPQRQRHLPVPQ